MSGINIWKKAEQDNLYESNQKLGYRINYLNDENNFYNISINNIKKLNSNLDKHFINHNHQINTLKDTNITAAQNYTEPYTIINHKIQLKNIQIQVGNQKRKAEKLKKIFQGSISSLMKKSQILQNQINQLAREYESYIIEEEVISNIYKADIYEIMYQKYQEKISKEINFITNDSRYHQLLDQYFKHANNLKNNSLQKIKRVASSKNISLHQKINLSEKYLNSKPAHHLKNSSVDEINVIKMVKNYQIEQRRAQQERQEIQQSNKLQALKKQEKEIKKSKVELQAKNEKLIKEREALLQYFYKDKNQILNQREIQAGQVYQLRKYKKQEDELLKKIEKQDLLLEEQYKINQDQKQKLIDRNQQENKEIRILDEEISKCRHQIKEMKGKCEELDSKNRKKQKSNS